MIVFIWWYLYRCNDDEYDDGDDDGGGESCESDEYVEYADEYEYDICLFYD
jgi:hypothetical protein